MAEPEPSGIERRRYPRFALGCPIEFSGDLIEGKGNAADISRLGCKVEIDIAIKQGTYLNLRIHLPNEALPLKIELAVVRWIKEGAFGTEFIRIHSTQEQRLKDLIKFLEMLPKDHSPDASTPPQS